MRLLEFVHGGNDVLHLVQSVQREELKKSFGIRTINLTRLTKEAMSVEIKKNIVDFTPTAILVRGITALPAVTSMGTTIPIFLDHCTPTELGKTSPMRDHLFKIKRAIAYSQKAEEDLRDAGLRRIQTVSGPYLPDMDCPLPDGRTTVAVLDTCPASRQVLDHIRAMRTSKGWDIDIVTTMVASDVQRVESAPEAAERAHLLLAVYDEMDYGQPHDAAILALGFRRALATSRTSAFSILPYPSGSFLSAPAHSAGAYSAAVATFLRDPRAFLEWPHKTKTADELPGLLTSWVNA